MARRHWWQRVGQAAGKFWETLTGTLENVADSLPDLVPPPEKPKPKFDRTGIRTLPAGDVKNVHLIDWDDHGPYPSSWDQAARDLWDTEPNTVRDLIETDEEWQDMQSAFDVGWIQVGITREEHEAGRQLFYELTGTVPSSFDWAAWREYMRDRDTPNAGKFRAA